MYQYERSLQEPPTSNWYDDSISNGVFAVEKYAYLPPLPFIPLLLTPLAHETQMFA